MQVAKLLLEEVQRESPAEWQTFQAEVSALKLQRTGAQRKLADLRLAVADLAAAEEFSASESDWDMSADEGDDSARTAAFAAMGTMPVRIVMVTGFESFNQSLYRTAAKKVRHYTVPVQLCASCAHLAPATCFMDSLVRITGIS